ncbi:MAG TPA: glycosyltransferase family 4 protein [Flavobacterium sp.]|nr:glycosyltransferase family 4 protein [Flavobacterium sp.]
MKLLFIHDHPFYRDTDTTVYTGGSFPKELWHNYLINFKTIKVFARNSKSLKSKNGLSSASNVTFHLTDKYSSVLNLIKNKRSLEQEIEALVNEADVVLVRLPSILGFIAAGIVVKNNKTLWVEQVGNAKEALGSYGSILGKVAAPFFENLNKKIVKKAAYVSYVTENKLQKDYPSNKNAVSVSLSNVIINTILNKHEVDKNRFFGRVFSIGLIGGFDARYKGQDILLNAISLLEEDIRKNIKISLIGKGDHTWVLNFAENLNLKDNIEYIGPLEAGNQINEFLKTLSLYVQPSLTEGMPRATIEAMAAGCPVIGSNAGGLPDIVSEKFVHKKGDIHQLAADIKQLYLNRKTLMEEALFSLEKAVPYLKVNLNQKRLRFYTKMNERIK